MWPIFLATLLALVILVSLLRWFKKELNNQIRIFIALASTAVACITTLCSIYPTFLAPLAIPSAGLLVLATLWLNRIGKLAFVAAALPIAWWGQYEWLFNGISADGIEAVLQTDLAEAIGYFFAFLPATPIVAWLVLVFVVTVARRLIDAAGLRQEASWMGVLLLVSLPFAAYSAKDETVLRAKAIRDGMRNFQANIEATRTSTGRPDSTAIKRNAQPYQVVVLLGESTTRHYFSSYGYDRKTDSFDGDKGIFLQRDTIAAYSHTVPSVLSIFLRPDTDKTQTISMLTRLQRAGVRTAWLSNQSKMGAWDHPVARVAAQAGDDEFLSSYRDGLIARLIEPTFDDQLIPLIEKRLDSNKPPQIIFAHLIATHGPYCRYVRNVERYMRPSRGAEFFGDHPTDVGDVACYEAAVRYLSEAVSRVISNARNRQSPTVVIYFPDHGEAPALGTGHNAAKFSSAHVEIPLAFYANDAARVLLGDKLTALEGNLNKRFFLPFMHETLLDLFEIADTGERRSSLLSQTYEPKERIVHKGTPLEVYYDSLLGDQKDYLALTRLVATKLKESDERAWAKIFAHRTDTIGKLLEAKLYFSGVEVDVVFNPERNEFRVYHPPASDVGLTLETFLQAANDRPDLKFWLDWKNPDRENIDAALTELRRLGGKFRLSKRAIIETPADATTPQLAALKDLGFRHAYYLPTDEIVRCSSASTDSVSCDAVANRIIQNAQKVGASTLSFDYSARGFMKSRRTLFAGFSLITWDLKQGSTDQDLVERSEDVAPFEAFIVTFPSPFSR